MQIPFVLYAIYACQYKLVWRLSEFAFFMRLLRWAHFFMKGYSKMVEEIINELKNSNAKLGKTVDFGCENVNIILDSNLKADGNLKIYGKINLEMNDSVKSVLTIYLLSII